MNSRGIMVKARDWAKDVEGTDIEFIGREGNYLICLICSKDGFIFKPYRTTWPPTRLTPEVTC
jgi:predicted amidohydrolase